MGMKLTAIYNVWHDYDWLKLSIDNIRPVVDNIIIVASEKSNYGEESPIPTWLLESNDLVVFEPAHSMAMVNETDKRNVGLTIAKSLGYTHFIMMDADEFYDREDFEIEKQRFIDNPDLSGLVCGSMVYFGKPSLTIGMDTTRVPFIHKITPTLKHEFNRSYPFAWEGREIRIDPTRSLNINAGVEWSPIVMAHYSWVRKDIEVKIRNSTARANIERSTLRKDFALAKEGYFVEYYGKTLIRASVDFNIPEFDVPDIQKPLAAETSPQPEDS
jgi:hypothetical protein